MYYGQFGEDQYLERYFAEKYGANYVGNCIDIGASDGMNGSNTYFFEKNGWDCICVEANPNYADAAKKIRKNVFNFGISNIDKKDADFMIYTLYDGSETAISSLTIDSRLENQLNNLIKSTSIIQIEILTLDTLLDSINYCKKIDFVSIDTEGTEIDVLGGFDLLRWKPEILVIENNYKDVIISEYASKYNYEKMEIELGVNQLYKYKG